jgi:sugar (pentulose or hexulose) kinase
LIIAKLIAAISPRIQIRQCCALASIAGQQALRRYRFRKVIAQASATHAFIDGLPRGRLEQDPHTWCDAAEQVIQTCLEKNGEHRNELLALGVSAQQHALVTLDRRPQHLGSDRYRTIAADRLIL